MSAVSSHPMHTRKHYAADLHETLSPTFTRHRESRSALYAAQRLHRANSCPDLTIYLGSVAYTG
jgi:hypothetical protein